MAKKAGKQERAEAPLPLQRRMPKRGKPRFLLWNLGLLLLACGVLSFFTLWLSYSNLDPEIWLGYWEDLWIPLLNLGLICVFCLLLFGLLGRAWLAFLLTALAALGIAVGNYYLIIIRSDPLQFEDLSCLREALAITSTQGYELELSPRLLLSCFGALGLSAMLGLLARWRPRWGPGRFLGLALAISSLTCCLSCASSEQALELTKNYQHINTWSVTEIYVSRGIVLSFVRSMFYSHLQPSGYSEEQARDVLAQYSSEDIPQDRKVDVFVVMRESYADLSELNYDESALDLKSCYADYHSLVNESVLMGNLVTNGFGGDTKNAERCFLTGNYSLQDWRKPTNSYVWYLDSQGYRTEGAHPFNGWFYNRLNVNRYLGFDDYLFRENCFDALVGSEEIAEDEVLYDVIWNRYQEHLKRSDQPYFNFTVTYEGHGPYNYLHSLYPDSYVLQDAKTPDGVAMNNYLGCCAKRDRELLALVDRFRSAERPIVLLTFGDHKATLGKDIYNYTTSAYAHYGMDLDLSTEQGFFRYYSTDYVIWMNDAARERLGYLGKGLETGPILSPCYLMNQLFDALRWGKGPAYLQAMADMMQDFPVYSTKGRISVEGQLRTTLPTALKPKYLLMQYLSYYWQTQFQYRALSES